MEIVVATSFLSSFKISLKDNKLEIHKYLFGISFSSISIEFNHFVLNLEHDSFFLYSENKRLSVIYCDDLLGDYLEFSVDKGKSIIISHTKELATIFKKLSENLALKENREVYSNIENNRKFIAVKENVPGDFYVKHDCCTMCGVPDAVARNLFGGFDGAGQATHDQCFVKKQPENDEELNQMLSALSSQELNCIRYCGKDRKIKDRIIALGEKEQIDWK